MVFHVDGLTALAQGPAVRGAVYEPGLSRLYGRSDEGVAGVDDAVVERDVGEQRRARRVVLLLARGQDDECCHQGEAQCKDVFVHIQWGLGGLFFFSGNADQQLVHALAVHVDDFEVQVAVVESVAGLGQASDEEHRHAAQGCEALVVDVLIVGHVDFVHKVVEVHRGIDEQRAVAAAHHLAFLRFVLLEDVAEDAFRQVVQGDDTLRAAVFVDDDGELRLVFLEKFDDLSGVECVRYEERRPGYALQVEGFVAVELQDEVLYGDNAHNFILVVVDEGVFAEFVLLYGEQYGLLVVVRVDSHDVGARGHELVGLLVRESEHVAQHFGLVLVDDALLRTLVQDDLQVFLRHGTVVAGADAEGPVNQTRGEA